jgi:hypothetical protein
MRTPAFWARVVVADVLLTIVSDAVVAKPVEAELDLLTFASWKKESVYIAINCTPLRALRGWRVDRGLDCFVLFIATARSRRTDVACGRDGIAA